MVEKLFANLYYVVKTIKTQLTKNKWSIKALLHISSFLSKVFPRFGNKLSDKLMFGWLSHELATCYIIIYYYMNLTLNLSSSSFFYYFYMCILDVCVLSGPGHHIIIIIGDIVSRTGFGMSYIISLTYDVFLGFAIMIHLFSIFIDERINQHETRPKRGAIYKTSCYPFHYVATNFLN